MTALIKGLVYLGGLCALTYWLDTATAGQVAPFLRPWAALVAAIFLVLGASNFFHLLRGYGQGDASHGKLLERASTGEPPAAGGPMLVSGTVRINGAALRAPLSGVECVAYEYRLYQYVKEGSRRTALRPIWWGFACQPFRIETRGRTVRVAAMPTLVDDPLRERTDATVARAKAYIAQTRFEDVAGLDLVGTVRTVVSDIFSEQSTGLRRDWHRTGAAPDVAELQFEERIVPVGGTASVAGHWSLDQQALVPEPGGLGGSPLTITMDGVKSLLGRNTAVPSSARAVAIFGVLLLAAGLTLVWAMHAGHLASRT